MNDFTLKNHSSLGPKFSLQQASFALEKRPILGLKVTEKILLVSLLNCFFLLLNTILFIDSI